MSMIALARSVADTFAPGLGYCYLPSSEQRPKLQVSAASHTFCLPLLEGWKHLPRCWKGQAFLSPGLHHTDPNRQLS